MSAPLFVFRAACRDYRRFAFPHVNDSSAVGGATTGGGGAVGCTSSGGDTVSAPVVPTGRHTNSPGGVLTASVVSRTRTIPRATGRSDQTVGRSGVRNGSGGRVVPTGGRNGGGSDLENEPTKTCGWVVTRSGSATHPAPTPANDNANTTRRMPSPRSVRVWRNRLKFGRQGYIHRGSGGQSDLAAVKGHNVGRLPSTVRQRIGRVSSVPFTLPCGVFGYSAPLSRTDHRPPRCRASEVGVPCRDAGPLLRRPPQ